MTSNLRNWAKWGLVLFLAFTFTYAMVDGVNAASAPGQPAAPTAVAGNKQATVTFAAPMDGGSPITSFIAKAYPGGNTCTANGALATNCTITGLTNGQDYTFTVAAVNAVGTGPESTGFVGVVTPSNPPLIGEPIVGEATWINKTLASFEGNKALFTSDGTKAFYAVRNSSGNNSTLVMDYLTSDSPSERLNLATNEIIGGMIFDSSNANLYVYTEVAAVPATAHIYRFNVSDFSLAATVNRAIDQVVYLSGRNYLLALAGTSLSKLDPATLAQIGTSSTATFGSHGLAVDSAERYAYSMQWTNLSNTPTCLLKFDLLTWTSAGSSTCATGGDTIVKDISINPNGGIVTIERLTRYAGKPSRISRWNSSLTRSQVNVPFVVLTAKSFQNGRFLALAHYTSPAMNYGVSIFDTVTMQVTQTVNLGTAFIASEIAITSNNHLRIFQDNATGVYRDVYLTDVADKPTAVTGQFGNGLAVVSWAAPSYIGSSNISSYRVVASPGGQTCYSSTTSCEVVGLSNGTAYTFSVYANNDQGESPVSTASATVVPATVPSAPTSVSARVSGIGKLYVTWTAPSDNGGASVSSYRVTSTDTADTCLTTSGTQLYCEFSNLTVGRDYIFQVAATNKAGEGSVSEPSIAEAPVTKPNAPTAVVATYGNASASLTWTAPEYDGGISILSFNVISVPGAASCLVTFPSTSCTITGLTNGTSYRFYALATNSVGTSVSSAYSAAITPKTVPAAPTSVIGSVGDTSVTVSWLAPANNGGATVSGYTVTASPDGGTCTTTGALNCVVTGLTNGTTYTFTVKASNSEGEGVASSTSAGVVPNVVPLAPTSVSGTYGAGQAAVSWTAPESNGGTAITSYTVISAPGGLTCVATSGTTCIVTGLVNGTAYTFKVRANNALGAGALSAASSAVTPKTVPGAPTSVTGVSGDARVTVSWLAPAANGGAAVSSYTVTATPGGATCTATGITSCVVSGLTNGSSFTFKVVATNSEGSGATSLASAAVIPNVVPNAPAAPSVTYGNSFVDVSWFAPVANGGTAITGYQVATSSGTLVCTTTTATSCRVSGLVNGTSYQFFVRAVNAKGTSPSSSLSSVVIPRTIPGSPVIASATRGNGGYSFTIGVPSNTGGAAIISYAMTVSPGGATCSATPGSNTCAITGLTNGVSYTFSVTATNSEGTGPATTFVGVPDAVPQSPTSVAAVYSSANALVSWVTPETNGGTALTSYRVTSSTGGRTCTAPAGTNSCVVSGLTNGASYTFTVVAINAAGSSVPSSPSNSVIPRLVPPAVSNASAAPTDGSVLVTWDTPAGINAANVSYQVVSNPGNVTCVTTGSSCLVERLANGNPYTFVITPSYLSGGAGTPVSTITVTPGAVADAPTGVQAISAYLGAVVTWLAPIDTGGIPISSYTVTASPGGRTCAVSAPATTCNVTGLTEGQHYTFTVIATNAKGDSPESLASNSVLVGQAPDAPNSIYGIAGSNQVSVFWSAPLNTGGLDVTHYVATSTPGGFICVTNGATKCVIGGLANGINYTFTVRAYTEFGASAESIASSPVKPANKNNQPSDISSMFLSPTELRVVWNKVTGTNITVNSYLVELTESSYPFETLESVSLSATEHTYVFTDLLENYGYQIRVTALDVNLDELGVLSLNDQNSPLPAMYVDSVITGSIVSGSTLTSNYGSWMGIPVPTITRQWYACNVPHLSVSILPTDCLAIKNATSATFVTSSVQAGKYLMVGVTAKNSAGTVVNYGATTEAIGLAPKLGTAPAPKFPTKVVIPAYLDAVTGTWTGGPTPTITVQWQRCSASTKANVASLNVCSNIDSATGSRYTTSADDVAKFIRYVVKAENIYGTVLYYSASSTVVLTPPVATINPIITGTMNVAQVISVTNGTWTGAPSFKYQWYKCSSPVTESLSTLTSGCVAIARATKAQYTILRGDLDGYLMAQVTATNSAASSTQYSVARRVTAP